MDIARVKHLVEIWLFYERATIDTKELGAIYDLLTSQQQEIERLKGEGWISVDVRLPEIGETVLCYSSSNSPHNIFSEQISGYQDFDYGKRCLVTDYHEYVLSSDEEFFWGECVTHWQPLPKAPEIKEQ